ncbi:Syntaxin 17 [Mactra antiquata]
MFRYNSVRDWDNLHYEQINATRTIQQIKANIQEIEKCRLQVCDEDLDKFDAKTDKMTHDAIKSVQELIALIHGRGSDDEMTASNSDSSPDDDTAYLSSDFYQTQIQFNEIPQNTQVAESWETLQENLEELNDLIHQFGTVVNTQQEQVDQIENNIESAHTDVRKGTKHLAKAAGYETALFPLAGAVLGTCVGVPIGLVAGAKIGVCGFFSCRFLKKRKDKITELELNELSRSNSLPDFSGGEPVDNNSWFVWRKRNQSTEIDDTGS